MENKRSALHTPGFNKRRLRRDTNTAIDSAAKPMGSLGALPEISLTKPKAEEEKKEFELMMKPQERTKTDPLLKF